MWLLKREKNKKLRTDFLFHFCIIYYEKIVYDTVLVGKLGNPDFGHLLALLGVQSLGVLICQLTVQVDSVSRLESRKVLLKLHQQNFSLLLF